MIIRTQEEKETIVAEYYACKDNGARKDVLERYNVNQSCVSRWRRGMYVSRPGRPVGSSRKPVDLMTPALEEAVRKIVRDELAKQGQPVEQPTPPTTPNGEQLTA